MHIRVCKLMLGVHRKTTNNAVQGELGCYPLLISMLAIIINLCNVQQSSTLVPLLFMIFVIDLITHLTSIRLYSLFSLLSSYQLVIRYLKKIFLQSVTCFFTVIWLASVTCFFLQ